MDKLDFLDGDTPAETAAPTPEAPAPQPAAQAPETAPASDGPPRGPDGKFAPKAPAEAAPAAQAEPQAPATPPEAVQPVAPDPARPPEGYVPLSALHAERDKRVALERQVQEYAQPRLQPGEEGYEEQQDAAAYEATVAGRARVQIARAYAVKAHGEAAVDAALNWARERADHDAAFRAQSVSAEDPVAFAMEEHEYHQALGALRDPTARANFKAFLSGQAPAQPSAPALVVTPSPSPSPPPQSLASAPNAGGGKPGAIPVGPNAAFDSVFKE